MSQAQAITVPDGAFNYTTGETITDDHFGGVFVGFRNIDRFEGFLDTVNDGMVRWPGGHAAETADWYGLEFHDLVDPDSNKAGLTEVLALAVENDIDVAIVVPTMTFANDPQTARDDLYAFLERLFDGELGELPDTITLELGNEYYGVPEYRDDPGHYGEIANAMLEGIADYLDDHPMAALTTELVAAVQFGRNASDDAAIAAEMSDTALEHIDALIYHRYAWTLDGADTFVQHFQNAFDNWVDAGVAQSTDIFVSEWNIASWSRAEALTAYTNAHEQYIGAFDASSVDLDARNDADFEHFWQTGALRIADGSTIDTQWGVANRDYGLAQAGGMLEIFDALLETGADAAALYGIDTQHAARVSFGDELFVGAAMFQMMSETLPGTSMLELGIENARDGDINIHAYEGNGQLVIYVSADHFENGQTNLEALIDLSGIDYEIYAVTGRMLTSVADDDWMETFGIPDTTGVDESPEARLYERGVITDYDVALTDDTIALEFDTAYEVIELVIQIEPIVGNEEPAPSAPPEVNTVGTGAADTLLGSSDSEVIHAGSGADIITARLGDDEIYGGNQGDTIMAGGGNDTVYSGLGNDNTHLGRGDDYYIDGNQNSVWGASVVRGGAGDDEIYGRGGDDDLDGGVDNDIVDGGAGNDRIAGGSGTNILTGGQGNDDFVFDRPGGTTYITDFNAKEDQIDLTQLLDGFSQYSIRLGEREMSLVGTFEDPSLTPSSVNLDVEQSGNDVIIYLTNDPASGTAPREYIILEDTNISDISLQDFTF